MKLALFIIAVGLCGAAAGGTRAADERILSRVYDASQVVRVEGRAGVQATIAFADQEQIENVAIGDSTSWQVTPNKRANLLFVKPLGPNARTNMTVVTDRHMYLFDLAASPTAPPVYVLRFTYPNEPKTERPAVGGMSADEALALASPPKEVADPSQLNFAWRTTGAKKLLPARIYDDGDATYITWAPGAAIPAILARNGKGEEGAVNYAVRGQVTILDSVPQVIVLRSGRDMATLENQQEPKLAMAPPTGPATAVAVPAQAAAQPEGR
jgi:type IV secretion system protein VirB9